MESGSSFMWLVAAQNDCFLSSQVIHKAALDVDERGTEAAAAAATTAPKIMALTLAPRIEFNHPFLMLIFDRDTNSTLFIGKIANPSTTSRSEI